MAARTDAENAFARLKDTLMARSEQIHGADSNEGARPMFGSTSIKTGAKMFAFLHKKTRLVVKLPEARVKKLIAGGQGEPYDPGDGRIQREWVIVVSAQLDDWLALATDAEAYVATLK